MGLYRRGVSDPFELKSFWRKLNLVIVYRIVPACSIFHRPDAPCGVMLVLTGRAEARGPTVRWGHQKTSKIDRRHGRAQARKPTVRWGDHKPLDNTVAMGDHDVEMFGHGGG